MRAVLLPLALLPTLAAPALAQPMAPKASRFTVAEAADCGVVFARIAEAVREDATVPDTFLGEVMVGLSMWEYELSAAAPGGGPEVEKVVLAAIDDLVDALPQGDDPSVRGDFLMGKAKACGAKMDTAYNGQQHPVAAQIARAAGVQQAAAQPAVVEPAAEKPRKRGLR